MSYIGLPPVYIRLLLEETIVCTPIHTYKQPAPIQSSKISESITPKTLSSTKREHTKFQSIENKEEDRGVLPTMWMKEIITAVPGCFIGCRQPRILEENIAELSLCIWVRERRERGLFELKVNAVKMVELAYLHPGSAQRDYRHRFMSPIWQHHLIEFLKAPPH